MKVNITLDITPAEAKELFGVDKLQDMYLEQLKKLIQDNTPSYNVFNPPVVPYFKNWWEQSPILFQNLSNTEESKS